MSDLVIPFKQRRVPRLILVMSRMVRKKFHDEVILESKIVSARLVLFFSVRSGSLDHGRSNPGSSSKYLSLPPCRR